MMGTTPSALLIRDGQSERGENLWVPLKTVLSRFEEALGKSFARVDVHARSDGFLTVYGYSSVSVAEGDGFLMLREELLISMHTKHWQFIE